MVYHLGRVEGDDLMTGIASTVGGMLADRNRAESWLWLRDSKTRERRERHNDGFLWRSETLARHKT
jgi:hypothetical protein